VIDAFDAMMSSRSYRGPLPVQAAVDELIRCSGTQWDPRVVRLFIAMAAEEFNEVFDTVGGVHSPDTTDD
jgi:HD-GYP domain-containing protein (c-di-GMP phosphodiesterase class II)